MIDTDKYEGHTPAPWQASDDRLEHGWIVNSLGWRVYVGEHEERAEIENHTFAHDELSEADARLIADAPLLLEEVKHLREKYGAFVARHVAFMQWMIENHDEIVNEWEASE